ncbi:MAG: hypothetical protein NWF04_09985 [Candidatus Bathyarchaeota archaeon]|nr:hypothetical protein [Candidatus Bathyarchaeota archaeon]
MSSDALRTRKLIGAVAIALLAVFTVLGILGVLSTMEWIIADVIVAVIANLLFKRVGNITY